MPYVNIKVTDDDVTMEQKLLLIKGVTQLLFDVLGKAPNTTTVIIEEINTDNWGRGGDSLTNIRKN